MLTGKDGTMTRWGTLCLLDATTKSYRLIDRIDLFDDVSEADCDVWSHPALVGNRLYVRNSLGVY